MPQPKRRRQVAVKPVPVEIGEERRHLLFDFYALSKIEEVSGLNTLNGEFWRETSATNLSIALWAGLLHEDESLDTEDPREGLKRVRRMLTVADLEGIGNTIEAAFNASMPDPETQDPLPTDAPQAG